MRRFASLSLTASVFTVALFATAQFDARAATVELPRTTVSDAGATLRLAQSGSMGGTLGNREKSLSGSRDAEPARPARQSQPKESRRPAPARRNAGGGGGGNFDGTWSLSSAGINCTDTFREVVTVNGRQMTGAYGSASISASGSISGSGNYNGIGVTSRGRLSGRSGSGTFQRSDGCHGRWTASKR